MEGSWMAEVSGFCGGRLMPLVVWDESLVGRGRAVDGRIGDAGWFVLVGCRDRQAGEGEGEGGLLCWDFCGRW